MKSLQRLLMGAMVKNRLRNTSYYSKSLRSTRAQRIFHSWTCTHTETQATHPHIYTAHTRICTLTKQPTHTHIHAAHIQTRTHKYTYSTPSIHTPHTQTCTHTYMHPTPGLNTHTYTHPTPRHAHTDIHIPHPD